ncbi:MAG: hypothetical protein WCW53_14090 [Syntrophales bacterium]|jgi:hypothetical protein
MEEQLNLITRMTENERKKLLSWIASLSEEKIIEIFQDGVKKSFQLNEERPNIPGRTNKYCAFILAARKAGWDTIKGKGYRVAEKKQYDDFSCLRKASAAALIKKGRTPILRRKILAYWGEVKELKAEGMGFRPIADYLSRTRKVKTSATYLAKLWKEVEANG